MNRAVVLEPLFVPDGDLGRETVPRRIDRGASDRRFHPVQLHQVSFLPKNFGSAFGRQEIQPKTWFAVSRMPQARASLWAEALLLGGSLFLQPLVGAAVLVPFLFVLFAAMWSVHAAQ